MGLYVAEEYGGAGLSQTGYARVFEAFVEGGGSLGVALGVHQSIGMKGISMFGKTFCTRAARRVKLELDKIERNDDERMHSIARLAYKRGAYGYALFED
jgi:alkylation response protein AidB-like acyl-CoA dehydrogenase